MNRIKAFAVASCLGLLVTAFVPARADEWNKKTILTVNEPVALPNTVLQPGKYVMKLMDSASNRHIVQVFDEGEQKLITTILAIPNQRLQPADDTSFSFWETASDQPRALRSWFYPGDNFGHEFAYPKDMATRIAKATNQNVPAIMNSSEDVTKAEVQTITPSGEAQDITAESTESSSTSTAMASQASTASSETAQSSTASAAAPADQNVHAMPQNQPSSTASAQPSTDTAASTASADTSMSASASTDTGAHAGVSADASSGAADASLSARNELPQTASPLPLTGLAGLAAAAAALAARAASKR
ncbi:MAG TPA: hypothetical protein VN428_23435 [Bryobacteraceae bacterium]|nr:hypothetical protein [Bryobacteraceae bacterium]